MAYPSYAPTAASCPPSSNAIGESMANAFERVEKCLQYAEDIQSRLSGPVPQSVGNENSVSPGGLMPNLDVLVARLARLQARLESTIGLF